MKLVYTHENRFLVSNIQNILENAGIAVMIKNEYAAGGAGDIAPHETWPELWVLEEDSYPQAMALIKASQTPEQLPLWVCPQCHEQNDGHFEICWNCLTAKPD